MKRLLLSMILLGFAGMPGAAQAPTQAPAAPAGEADPALKFLEMALASQHVKEQRGGPKKGFYLLIENQTKSPLQFAFAIEASGLPDSLFFRDEGLVQGWWKVEPGKSRKIFIDRVLPKEYFTHARNATVFWGKDKTFAVPSGDGEKAVVFSRREASAQCRIEDDGTVVCTHRFKE